MPERLPDPDSPSVASDPTTVDRVEFVAVAPRTIALRESDAQEGFELALQIANRGDAALRFALEDATSVVWTDTRGIALPVSGGTRAAVPGDPCSAPVQPGESIRFAWSARLAQRDDGTFSAIAEDAHGGVWHVDGITPGPHRFQIEYASSTPSASGTVPVWSGNASTLPLEILFR